MVFLLLIVFSFVGNSEDIVKGDVLVFEARDTIPTAVRIIYESSLNVDESSLTGESISVNKTVDILDEDTPLQKKIDGINIFFASYCRYNFGDVYN